MAVQLATVPSVLPALVLTTEAPPLAARQRACETVYVPITRYTFGFVYVIHFSCPLGNLDNPRAQAQHYTGFSLDPLQRFREHCAGQGAKITQAAVLRGITLMLVACWPALLMAERVFKRRVKKAPRFCPTCCEKNGWRCRTPQFDAAEPWDDEEDFPPIPAGRDHMDGYELAWLRSCVRVTHFDLGNTEDWDIPF